MQKFLSDVLFGCAFGIGFSIAQAVLAFIVQILSGGVHHPVAQ